MISYEDAFEKRASFVKNITETLVEYRKIAFKYPHLQNKALTLRHLWKSWKIWSTKDKIIDDRDEATRINLLKSRTRYRRESIILQMKNWFKQNHMEFPENTTFKKSQSSIHMVNEP